MKPAMLLYIVSLTVLSCSSQTGNGTQPAGMSAAANAFLESLSAKQRSNTKFLFDEKERYNWHYIPKERKGISLGELDTAQKNAAFTLLRTALSTIGYHKTIAVIQLEAVLREAEGRSGADNYRDPGKYYFSIFGNPATDAIWGWRFEGHHLSLHFSTKDNLLISGTPGFLGANPAIVSSGSNKGTQVLKEETEYAFALLHSLEIKQIKKVLVSTDATAEIITGANRRAMISDPVGVLYSELNSGQQTLFLRLLSVYIQRYTASLAARMMQDIKRAGLNQLRFAWAGATQPGAAHYYRIQGPSIIIEYANTQNNANHVHTVIRDLKHDFGGDELLDHYKNRHH